MNSLAYSVKPINAATSSWSSVLALVASDHIFLALPDLMSNKVPLKLFHLPAFGLYSQHQDNYN